MVSNASKHPKCNNLEAPASCIFTPTQRKAPLRAWVSYTHGLHSNPPCRRGLASWPTERQRAEEGVSYAPRQEGLVITDKRLPMVDSLRGVKIGGTTASYNGRTRGSI